MKLFEAFAGYGGASFALKKAGIPFELIGFSEIDKYAIKCFEQNHDEINLEGISDSQKYRLAGNGWEINVPKLIFEKLFAEMKP
jgi:site-specific DNA-cytosine methylase